MRDKPFRHPLAALRHELDLTAEEYLDRLSPVHAALGYGHLAKRREKVTRWESGIHAPETVTQYAMAAFHNVPREAVDEMGWPHWLLVSFPDDRPILDSPWTPMGTVRSVAAAARGGSVDRRGFLIASGATLTAVTAGWTDALSTTQAIAATRGRRRLTADTVTRLEQRLDDLRRLDDVLGGGELRPAAAAEFQLLSALANDATYNEDVGRRLLTALAESSRMCGWLHFDAGRHAGAQSFYITALRASATAGDHATGANILAFMAIQTYSTGNPQDAVNLVRTAQDEAAYHSTPRVRAMLHARAARALSKTGARTACARELDAARDAYAQGTHDDDPLGRTGSMRARSKCSPAPPPSTWATPEPPSTTSRLRTRPPTPPTATSATTLSTSPALPRPTSTSATSTPRAPPPPRRSPRPTAWTPPAPPRPWTTSDPSSCPTVTYGPSGNSSASALSQAEAGGRGKRVVHVGSGAAPGRNRQ
ncbi:hypothetical protein ACFQ2B_40760 [Streptomyces stramineus]